MVQKEEDKFDMMNKTENYGKNRSNYESIVSFFQDEDI